ncbi:PREDICTED: uncharacterized protein LOC106746208 [Dinoponera quadriceps]|uniref:Uncharacterized protein LOC106746208 n=1 Tax=Dinoponera quadriceps TaxID=609295 RepID=A0A6P3XHR3_DINQU|nr:PREDICTED: uncharacterized protein LOC106746208 [Dinoponera quadriceps]
MTISRANEQLDRKEPRRKKNHGKSSVRRCKHLSSEEDAGSLADDGVKRFHGDGLVVQLDSNHRMLEITGDGCRVILSRNSGSVHIVGDGCRLSVSHNVGDIEYTGDGGRVLLGPDSSMEKVKFVGDGGKVILDATGPEAAEPTLDYGKFHCCRRRRLEKFPLRDQRNGETEEAASSRGGVAGGACSREKCEGRGDGDDENGGWRVTMSSSSRECLENSLNDVKERGRQRGKYGKRDDQTRKSSRCRRVVTVTEIRGDGRCVRKQLSGDSSLIVTANGDVRSSSPP